MPTIRTAGVVTDVAVGGFVKTPPIKGSVSVTEIQTAIDSTDITITFTDEMLDGLASQ
ncbi:MAG: hypothetical protein OEV59_02305 [Deltaproteobacteria bacterium]|nr:hypothetical protein [Deltaproteobacteria bacterium]